MSEAKRDFYGDLVGPDRQSMKGFKKAFDDAAERGETRCPVCLATAHSKEYHENAAQPQAVGEVAKLVEKLRRAQEDKLATSIFGFSTSETCKVIADELEAALRADERDSLARKEPSPELGDADASGHPSPMRPGERSTAKADRSSPESLPPPQAASGGALSAEPLVPTLWRIEHCTIHENYDARCLR